MGKVYLVKADRYFDDGSIDLNTSYIDVLQIAYKKEDAIAFIKERVARATPVYDHGFEKFVSDEPEPEGDIFEAGKYWYEDESDMNEDPDYIGENAYQYFRAWVEEWEVE